MRLSIGVTLKASAWAEANRSVIWRAIEQLAQRHRGAPFTAGQLMEILNTRRTHDVGRFLAEATRSGQVVEATRGHFVLTGPVPGADETPAARRMQQMWNILRGPQARRGITARDLAMLAATHDTPVTLQQARGYLNALEGSSHVRIAQERGKEAIYRLPPDRNTGPLAPRVMATQFVVDPNGLSVSAAPIVAREAAL